MILLQGARQEGVIHPEEHIRQRRGFGQDGFVERGTGITALQKDHFGVILLLESGDHLLADREGIVRDDRQGFWLARLGDGEQLPAGAMAASNKKIGFSFYFPCLV